MSDFPLNAPHQIVKACGNWRREWRAMGKIFALDGKDDASARQLLECSRQFERRRQPKAMGAHTANICRHALLRSIITVDCSGRRAGLAGVDHDHISGAGESLQQLRGVTFHFDGTNFRQSLLRQSLRRQTANRVIAARQITDANHHNRFTPRRHG
jgi:hypothetical protein